MEHFPTLIDTKEDKQEVLETSLGEFAEKSKNEIMELLRTNGAHDKESLIAVHGWLDVQEIRVSADPTRRRYALLEIARSDFYLALNDTEEALNCLYQASENAEQLGHFDLQDIAEARIAVVMKVSNAITDAGTTSI